MSTVTGVVLGVGALATVLVIGFVVLVQVQRVRRAYDEATRTLERMRPVLDEIALQQEVTARELARVSAAREELRLARQARRRP